MLQLYPVEENKVGGQVLRRPMHEIGHNHGNITYYQSTQSPSVSPTHGRCWGWPLAAVPLLAACTQPSTDARTQSSASAAPTSAPTAAATAAASVGATAAATAVATAVAEATPETQLGSGPNVALIQRYYETYGQGDLNALRQFFAPSIMWRIPGQHPLSGAKQGADKVIAFFEQLGRAGFGANTIVLASGGDWVIDLHRGFSTQGEGRLDILWALAFRVQNNQIVEAINFAFDQAAANAFFWTNFPLRPLPDRLADAVPTVPALPTAPMPTPTGDGPAVAVIQRYYDTYGANDPNALRQFFAPNIQWHIPGQHPLAGTKHGPDEVLAFFQQLGRAGFRAETLVLASGG